MSQEKVAKYKEQKANRKQIMKRQKRAKIIRSSLTGLICVAVIGWVGYSAVDSYQSNQPRKSVEVDYAAINEYAESLNAE